MGAFDDIIAKYGNAQVSAPTALTRYGKAQPSAVTAFARFSRRPISFHPSAFPTLPPAGLYDSTRKSITVNFTPDAVFERIQGVIRHEDAHAVLDSVGRSGTALPPPLRVIPPNPLQFANANLPSTSLDQTWTASGRAGGFDAEIPAYMIAYRPGELPGITPDMAERWVNAYSKNIPNDARNKIVRLGEISRGVLK